MIRANNGHDVVTGAVRYMEYAGLHTDTKPTNAGTTIVVENGMTTTKTIAIATGSLFMEVDTGDVYAFDEAGSEWNKVCALGGDS